MGWSAAKRKIGENRMRWAGLFVNGWMQPSKENGGGKASMTHEKGNFTAGVRGLLKRNMRRSEEDRERGCCQKTTERKNKEGTRR